MPIAGITPLCSHVADVASLYPANDLWRGKLLRGALTASVVLAEDSDGGDMDTERWRRWMCEAGGCGLRAAGRREESGKRREKEKGES